MKPHYVYFIQQRFTKSKPIKIGSAKDVERRLGELQVGNPYELAVVAKLGPFSKREAEATERRLHEQCSRFHIRGEWFRQHVLDALHTKRKLRPLDERAVTMTGEMK